MDISKLKTGDDHYMAFVGPPTLYDIMGASQFRLLCALGLRAHDSLLDIGCGSLRGGRLFINYLDAGKYYGIEPNEWLIKDAIINQVGQDLIDIKKPQFDYNPDFNTAVFSTNFDFILAQSVYSHAGFDLIKPAMENSKESLNPDGLIAANFYIRNQDFNGGGWVYPNLVNYRHSTIKRLADELGLFMTRIPWYHPRLTWYLFAKNRNRLPNRAMRRYLSGVLLLDNEFLDSWNTYHKFIRTVSIELKQIIPKDIKNRIKQKINIKERDY